MLRCNEQIAQALRARCIEKKGDIGFRENNGFSFVEHGRSIGLPFLHLLQWHAPPSASFSSCGVIGEKKVLGKDIALTSRYSTQLKREKLASPKLGLQTPSTRVV